MAHEFDVWVNRNLTAAESDGKWDFEVMVTRKRDGESKRLRGSGGESTIDSMIRRLKAEIDDRPIKRRRRRR